MKGFMARLNVPPFGHELRTCVSLRLTLACVSYVSPVCLSHVSHWVPHVSPFVSL